PLGQGLLPGAALLSVRGKVLEHGMPRFFRRFAEGVFDIEDLKQRTHELAAFIEAAQREYQFGGEIVAVGYSNGANIAASLMMLHPGLLSGGVLFRAMAPIVPEEKPSLHGTRVLLAAGKRDPIARPDQPRKLAAILEEAGATVLLHWHDGGHEIGQDDMTAARLWLTKQSREPEHF
ncbi:MAG TPA: alpha/beta hydrolase, partial [Bryobacteraceae bacterium]|nr:alpha/beta hydrolase [Bryobacteraceae bacterium]